MFEELKKAAYPRQVILVTTRAEVEILGKKLLKDNIMTLSWHSPLSFEPLLYGILVGKTRFSHKLLTKSGVFVVNFIPNSLKKEALFCGRNSGEHVNKFKKSGLTPEEAHKVDCPRIKEALSYMECEIIEEIEVGDHTMFVGKVLRAETKKKDNRLFQVSGDEFTTTIGK
ncbi:flavin reductase family protein [Candidatus Woesearchaeota archaeon]|nr:flavin reductase family protein [Candidatus Woesearchaeota archaeon]